MGVSFRRPGWEWKLPLSLTYWMLVLLRSPMVPDLEEEDSPALFELREEFDSNATLAPLRDLATGKITYEVFRANVDQATTMEEYLRTTRRCFRSILRKADLLCTTPGAMMSPQKEYLRWRERLAQGVAISEASSMHRYDMYCVWGNTLLPCIMGGSVAAAPPVVRTSNLRDADSNVYHALINDAKLSAMTFLQASGMPVYRVL